MDEICDCGRIIVQPATGRRRQKCFVCSPRDLRYQRAGVIELPVRDPGEPTLVGTSRAALEQAGQLHTWRGAAALALAALVDAGSRQAAQLVREHREAMAHALQSVPDEDDVIVRLFAEQD
jgi:hypothetical protein